MPAKKKPSAADATSSAEHYCEGEFCSSTHVRTGFFKGAVTKRRALQYAVVGDLAMFEGDIVLGNADDLAAQADQLRAAMASGDAGVIAHGVVITGQAFRWPNATVPFTIDSALPNQQRVTDAIAHWEANTPIRFTQRTAANQAQFPNFVTFQSGGGCSSHVGMQGGQQFITLGAGCTTGNTIHEIGHAVGLWHEQSREDRDQFVQILFQNIMAGFEHNFNQHITDGDDIGAYDYGSIMHYPRDAFSRNGQDTIVPVGGQQIGQRTGLSPGDIATVRAIYPSPMPPGKHIVKDVLDNKRFKDAKDVKDRPDNQKRFKDAVDGGQQKALKDFKDRKDRLETTPFDRLGGGPSATDAEARIAALEQKLAQIEHFIDPTLRPELSTSPLSHETDGEAAALAAIESQLQQVLAQSAQSLT